MSGIGLSLPATALLRRGRAGLLPETQGLLARMAVGPSPARTLLISALIQALKAAGVWQKLDAFHVLAAHDAQAARLNWIADRFNLTAVNSPSFTADRGYASNGTSSYLDTGFTPSTAGGKFLQNSASAGAWTRTAAVGGLVGAQAMLGNVATYLYRSDGGANAFLCGLNGPVSPVFTVPYSVTGLFALNRTDASNVGVFVNGSVSAVKGASSSALESNKIFLLARSNGPSATIQYFLGELSCAFVGSGLSDAEMANLYAAVRQYLMGVGAAS